MKYNDVIKRLRHLGDEKTRTAWKRQGAPKEHFGVKIGELRILARTIGKDQQMAQRLWNTKYIDAKILATMIAEPKKMTRKELETRVKQIDFWLVSEHFAQNLVVKNPHRDELMRKWMRSRNEHIKLAGVNLLRKMPNKNVEIPDKEFKDYLKLIEKEIHKQTERLKQAMVYALIAIGKRNPRLNKEAIKVAKRIGKVEIDILDTSCKTPDIVEELTDGRVQARWETLVP